MYGLINLTVKDLVITKYGEEKWKEITKLAQTPESFEETVSYSDKSLYDLLYAASEVLNAPSSEILEAIGYWFIIYVRTKATTYGKLLDLAGSSFSNALKYINTIHANVRSYFPEHITPSMWCTDETPTSLRFHYVPGAPNRVGLGPLVIGLIKGLADIVFQKKGVSVTHEKFKDHGAAHDEFMVYWEEASESSCNDMSEKDQNMLSDIKEDLRIGLKGNELGIVHPFHFVFNSKMIVTQMGPSLSKIVSVEVGDQVSSSFSINQPLAATFTNSSSITAMINEPFLLTHRYSDEQVLKLRGQMVQLKRGSIAFIGLPMFTSIDEAKNFNLLLTDFSIIEREELFLMDARTTIFESASKMREEFVIHREKLIEMEKQKQKGNFFNSLFNTKKKGKDINKKEGIGRSTTPTPTSVPMTYASDKREDREMLGIRIGSNGSDPRPLTSSSSPPPLSSSLPTSFGCPFSQPSPATSPTSPTSSSTSPTSSLSTISPTSPRDNKVIITREDDEMEKRVGWDLLKVKKRATSIDTERTDRDREDTDRDQQRVKIRDLSPLREKLKGRSRASSVPSNESRFQIGHSLLSPTQEALQEILQAETWNSFPVISALLHRYIRLDDPDEVFSAVVYFLLQRGKILGLLETVFREEIENPESRTIVFRQESVATKLFSHYLQKEGNRYLKSLVQKTVQSITTSSKSFEVDPDKTDENVEENAAKLMILADQFLEEVFSSVYRCPGSLRRILIFVERWMSKKYDVTSAKSAIANLFFLRYVCVGLVNPEKVMKNNNRYNSKQRRAATIITKMLTKLVNGNIFHENNVFLSLNSFITPEKTKNLNNFIEKLLDSSTLGPAEMIQPIPSNLVDQSTITLRNAIVSSIDHLWTLSFNDPQIRKALQKLLVSGLDTIN